MQTLHVKMIFPTGGHRILSPVELGILFLGFFLIAVSGCKRAEKIRHIVVDADKSGIVIDDRVNSPPSTAATGPTDRMVVGIHETAEKTWTFKVSGPIAEVTRTEAQWMEFLRGVVFDDEGVPSWELPEGWKKAEITPGPFAPYDRFQISDTLQMSVSRLPPRFNLLSNVNRWNEQLSLPSVRIVELPTISGDSQVPFQMFDQVGSLAGGGSMMSGGARPPMFGGGDGQSNPVANPNESPIEYDAPENWKAIETSSMVPARFQVGDGDSVALIKVVRLPGSLNPWKQLAANWAGEIGLDPAEIDLDAESKEFEVDGLPGKMISHISEDEEIAGAVIGIRFARKDKAWIIKLTGPKVLVIESQAEFVEFAKSIRFK